MKAGTIIDVEGRGLATVVWNNLDGYGVIWGKQKLDITDLPQPEAMLRGQYKNPPANAECLGDDVRYKIIKEPKYKEYNPSCPPMFS